MEYGRVWCRKLNVEYMKYDMIGVEHARLPHQLPFIAQELWFAHVYTDGALARRAISNHWRHPILLAGGISVLLHAASAFISFDCTRCAHTVELVAATTVPPASGFETRHLQAAVTSAQFGDCCHSDMQRHITQAAQCASERTSSPVFAKAGPP